jgi:hypothetical protein
VGEHVFVHTHTRRTQTRPRRIGHRPSVRLRWRAAGPKAAHTDSNVATDAVFHAPMFALNFDAL